MMKPVGNFIDYNGKTYIRLEKLPIIVPRWAPISRFKCTIYSLRADNSLTLLVRGFQDVTEGQVKFIEDRLKKGLLYISEEAYEMIYAEPRHWFCKHL